jgi:outer membrane protein OmpA-like peptidoglycan-associated protein/tetratricopeptide (TPR) repeat protein
MKTHTYIKIRLVCLIFLFPFLGYADSHLKKANKLYDELSFAAAVPEYEKALKNDPNNEEALQRIAHCCRLINDTHGAEKYYAMVVKLRHAQPSHYLFYTQALMSNGKYPAAETWIKRYKQIAGSDEKSERILESLHQLNLLTEDSANYLIEKLSINSPNSDCSPVIYENGLVFASSRKTANIFQGTHDWTGQPFFSLYFAKGSNKNFEKAEEFLPSINTKYNNGSLCFSQNFDELYVTRNNLEEDKNHRNDTGIVKLKIYHYKKSGSKWEEATPFPFNSDDFNCAHPYLSVDGNKLFFASDMPGGYGGLDLYCCTRIGDGWGAPLNLGPAVNTFGNDGFPFIDKKEGLFYASDGRGGLGGYDIFYSPKSNGGYYGSINLGYPINSSGDDLSWVQNEDGSSGYFASNRNGNGENDEIYLFNRMAILLNVMVYDSKTKLPLIASTIRIIEDGREKKIITTTDSGMVSFLMTPGRDYRIVTEKDRYETDSINIQTKSMAIASTQNLTVGLEKKSEMTTLIGQIIASDKKKTGLAEARVRLVDKETGLERYAITAKDGTYKFKDVPVDKNFRLDAKKKNFVSMPVDITSAMLQSNSMIKTNLVMNKAMDIVKMDNIYYDLNKFYIRHDASLVLDNLVIMLKSNPKVKIELRSHTDCRNTEEYNQILSEKRAQAAVEYLIKKGISANRLTSKGFGESMPEIECDCYGQNKSSPCSEKEFQRNRRTEFRIISIN